MNLIEIIDLNFSYDKIKVLNNLSLNIDQEESLGIIGSNGAGKTTLFHLICGILKTDTGSIKILNKNIIPQKFNPMIGYVFQNPDDQLFSLTVLEDLTFGPLNMGLSYKEADTKAIQTLSDMQLLHLKDRSPHHLSLGEKRMVSIASVLSLNPEIIIFDEPTSNLDSISRRKLINYLNTLHKTKIIASHDLEFILETCQNTTIIYNGKIEEKGKSKEILSNKELMNKCHQEIPWSIIVKKN